MKQRCVYSLFVNRGGAFGAAEVRSESIGRGGFVGHRGATLIGSPQRCVDDRACQTEQRCGRSAQRCDIYTESTEVRRLSNILYELLKCERHRCAINGHRGATVDHGGSIDRIPQRCDKVYIAGGYVCNWSLNQDQDSDWRMLKETKKLTSSQQRQRLRGTYRICLGWGVGRRSISHCGLQDRNNSK